MCDWIASHWREWLTRPEWWQALSAVIQATFAVLILFVTRKYVKLTNKLVDATIDPVIEWEFLDETQGYTASFTWTIRNIGVADVKNFEAECRLFAESKYKSDPLQPVVGKNAVNIRRWPLIASNGEPEQLQFYESIEHAQACKQQRELEEPQQPGKYTLDFRFRYQRVCDGRQYKEARRLDVKWNSKGEPFVVRSDLVGNQTDPPPPNSANRLDRGRY